MARGLFLFAIVGAALVCAEEIKPNWNKLTDFTATYEVNVDPTFNEYLKQLRQRQSRGLQVHEAKVETAHATGKMKADVYGERFEVTEDGSATYSQEQKPAFQMLAGGKVKGNSVFSFSAQEGFGTLQADYEVKSLMGPGKLSYCVNINIPRGMVPPGAMLKQQMEQQEPAIEAQLNQMPHSDVVVNGEHIALFKSPDGAMGGLRYDASPVGFGIRPPIDGVWNPVFNFKSWEEGAGEIKESKCVVATSLSEWLATPYSSHTLMQLDLVAMAMHNTPGHTTKNFPALPSAMIMSAAAIERASLSLEAQQQDGGHASLRTTFIVALVAGAMGSMLTLFIVRMTKKTPQSEALLAYA